MKYIQLFILLPFICSSFIQAITINGSDINDVLKPNQVLVFDNAQSSGVSIRTDADGNISVGSLELTRDSERDISKHYTMLEEYQCGATQQSRKQLCLRAGSAMHNDGAYIAAAESIALSAGVSMAFGNSILRAVDIYLESPQIAFLDSFVDADTLTLESTLPDSNIERITIVFDRELSVPPLITGFIDFKAHEIVGSIQQGMTIMGAKTVMISFAPHAFAYHQDDALEDEACCNDEVSNILPEASAQLIQDASKKDAQDTAICAQEAHQADDEQRDQVLQDEDEAELLNEMAVEQEEVQAMQERDICAQEIQLLEAADDIHEQQLMNECELGVKTCEYSDELPLDNVRCDLDEAVRCACCTADSDEVQDEKEEAPTVTKLQEYESLPEAKIANTELYVPVCASAAPVCCKSTGCARVEKVERRLHTHKRSSRLLDVLRGPVGIFMGVAAVGVLGHYAYTHLIAPTCNAH